MSVSTSRSSAPDSKHHAQNGDSAPINRVHAEARPPANSASTNGHAAPTPSANDQDAFARLMALAKALGRPDLVEEFRQRSDSNANGEAVEPIVPIKALPTVAPAPHAEPVPAPQRAAAHALACDGLRFLMANQLAEALLKFREAVTLDPGHHDAWGNLGVVLARMGKRADAEPCFREAIRIRPDNVAMYGNLAACCLQLGKFDEAETALRRAIELAPKETDIFRQLGMDFAAKTHRAVEESLAGAAGPKQEAPAGAAGPNSEAEAAYCSAIEFKPEDAAVQWWLGKLQLRLREMKKGTSPFSPFAGDGMRSS